MNNVHQTYVYNVKNWKCIVSNVSTEQNTEQGTITNTEVTLESLNGEYEQIITASKAFIWTPDYYFKTGWKNGLSYVQLRTICFPCLLWENKLLKPLSIIGYYLDISASQSIHSISVTTSDLSWHWVRGNYLDRSMSNLKTFLLWGYGVTAPPCHMSISY